MAKFNQGQKYKFLNVAFYNCVCARSCRSSRLNGGGHKKNNRENGGRRRRRGTRGRGPKKFPKESRKPDDGVVEQGHERLFGFLRLGPLPDFPVLRNRSIQLSFLHESIRVVARWYVFKPKIPIWVNFGGPWNEKVVIFYGHLEYFRNEKVVIFYGHLEYFTTIW
jgi:hypothetical protein